MIITLLGESNCGKSTIGKKLADTLDIKYVSSGDIARSMSEDVNRSLNNGDLAPEDAMREEILKRISDTNGNIILDGFPRFEDQYKWLNGFGYDIVNIIIEVPYSQIVARSKSRHRADDCSIEKKHKFYEENTLPMIREIAKYGDIVWTYSNFDGEDIDETVNLICDNIRRLENC